MHQNSNMLGRSYIQSTDNKHKHYITGSHIKPQSSREEMESHNYTLAAWLLTTVHNNRGGFMWLLLWTLVTKLEPHIICTNAYSFKVETFWDWIIIINEILVTLNDPVNISMHVAS